MKKQNDFFDLKEIIESLPGNVYWKNTKGEFQGCNKNLLQLFNFTKYEQIIGKTDYDLVDRETAREIIASDKMIMLENKPRNEESLGYGHLGKPEYYIVRRTPLHNRKGEVIGILGASLEITERKLKENNLEKNKTQVETLNKRRLEFITKITQEVMGIKPEENKSFEQYARELKSYFEEIIARMPGHVYWMSKDGTFLGCNNNLLKMHKLKSKDEYIGKTYEDFFDKQHAKQLRQVDANVIEQDAIITLEETAIREGQPQETYLTQKLPLHDNDNKVIGLLGASIDITDRKRAEKAQLEITALHERVQSLITLSASIAHELRTPLRAIDNCLTTIKENLPDLLITYQLAQEAKLDAPYISKRKRNSLNETLEIMQQSAEHAFVVIDMLLMKAKTRNLDANEFEPLSIKDVINTSLSQYPFQSDEPELVHWDDSKDFTFVGKEVLMKHIVFNLLKNAIYYVKAANKGQILMWLVLGKKYNEFHFKDTGAGIPSDILPHIFDQFFSRTESGTGTGLAYCQYVMQSFGGDITCESKEGEFTELTLLFPTSFKPQHKS